MIKEDSLYRWQKEAFNEWVKVGRNGLLVSITGSGKSIWALYCIQDVKCSTIIVVPSIVLMNQWKGEVLKHLDVKEEDVGLYYGEKKELKSITIAVINSIRPKDLSMFKMGVFDEVHKFASIENIKPIKRSNFKYKIGMTATLNRQDGKHLELIDLIGDKFYEYKPKEAIDEGVLNRFANINVGVEMDINERKVYDELDIFIKKNMPLFSYNFPIINKTANNFKHPQCRIAQQLRRKIGSRRMLYSNSGAKLEGVLEIIKKHKDDKIIVFNEFIGMAELIYDALIEGSYDVGIYHSNAKDLKIIDDFAKGNINILVAVRSLNEGLDIKSANVGIIVSGNTVRRDTIQRLGRVIRKEDNKKAYFYQLYCKYTKEAKDVSNRSATMVKEYDATSRDFSLDFYKNNWSK